MDGTLVENTHDFNDELRWHAVCVWQDVISYQLDHLAIENYSILFNYFFFTSYISSACKFLQKASIYKAIFLCTIGSSPFSHKTTNIQASFSHLGTWGRRFSKLNILVYIRTCKIFGTPCNDRSATVKRILRDHCHGIPPALKE